MSFTGSELYIIFRLSQVTVSNNLVIRFLPLLSTECFILQQMRAEKSILTQHTAA